MDRSAHAEVAIIGAGPYGLSIAAHLRAAGVQSRIFGPPMAIWRTRMPIGMFLKSEGRASSLSAPGDHHTLERFCSTREIPFKPWGLPVALDVFIDYGLWFQTQRVPDLDSRLVAACRRRNGAYELELEDGMRLAARRVIVATGITAAARMPAELARMPRDLVTHSSDHRHLDRFSGRTVAVIGVGQSALETAALLHEQGAQVTVIARRPAIAWNDDANRTRTLYQRLRAPMTPLGPGLRHVVYVHAIPAFRLLSESVRAHEVRTALGPAGAWWLKHRIEGHVSVLAGHALEEAALEANQVALKLRRLHDGAPQIVRADHVISGTGYEITPACFPFLDDAIMRDIGWGACGPVLSRDFESTAPGIHFVGLAAAGQFGPVMRFVAGAPYTARVLARHIARQAHTLAGARAA